MSESLHKRLKDAGEKISQILNEIYMEEAGLTEIVINVSRSYEYLRDEGREVMQVKVHLSGRVTGVTGR